MYSDKAPMPNNWQSPFAELAYFIRNFFLRLTTKTFMSGIPNHSLHSLITSTDTVRKFFIKTLFIVNSNDFSCVLLIGQASSAYNKHGIHFLDCVLFFSVTDKNHRNQSELIKDVNNHKLTSLIGHPPRMTVNEVCSCTMYHSLW